MIRRSRWTVGASTVAGLVTVGALASGIHGARGADGEIAFACNGDICVMHADGSGRRRLTHDKWIDSYPVWSPSGREIAYTASLAKLAIYLVSADGDARCHVDLTTDEALLTWSLDGRAIAFDDNRSGRIEVEGLQGRRRPLTRRQSALPSWSPDGAIAYVSTNGRRLALTSGDLYIVGANGKGERRLARSGTFPAWSPDGTTIAFLRNTRGTDAEVWVMRADATARRRVRRHAAQGGGLSWSPDGTHLAYVLEGDIYIVDIKGGRPERLTHGHGDNLNPAWQPRQTSDGSRTRSVCRADRQRREGRAKPVPGQLAERTFPAGEGGS